MAESDSLAPTNSRTPLPRWVWASTLAGGIFCLLWMGTGGAIAPWSFGLGGLFLVLLLLPATVRAMPRAFRFPEERLGWVLWLGVIFLGFVALQLVPLPPGWLETLSPRGAAIRRDLGGWDGVQWEPLSLAPSLTAQVLTVWLIGFLVLCTTVLTVRSNHLKRFAWLIAGGTGMWALYGLAVFVLERSTAEFKPFGVPLLPGRVTGPSVNPNRFAYVLEMGLPFCLLLFKSELERIDFSRRLKFRVRLHSFLTNRRMVLGTAFWGLTSLMVMTALVLTRSRGGISACVASLVLGFGLLGLVNREAPWRERLFNWRAGLSTLALVAVVLFCIGFGLDQLSPRFSILFSEKTPRWMAWRAILPMASDFIITGTGAGTFRDAFSVYQPPSLAGQYRFAHNEYLNLLTDMGLVGLGLGLVFVGLWFRAVWRKIKTAQPDPQRWRWCVLVGVLAVALHQIGDFGLQDPAVLWWFCLLLGLGICPSGGGGKAASDRGRRSRHGEVDAEEMESEGTVDGATAASFAVASAGPILPILPILPIQPVASGRVRAAQAVLGLGLLSALVGVIGGMPLTVADWIRPGSLWVHIDWQKGGVDVSTAPDELDGWQAGWERALAWTPTDPLANYQAANAEFYRLHRELADQPLLAPSLQMADDSIVLTRCKSPLEVTEDQRVRIAQARTRVERSVQGSPTRPEYHLLRLRLAVLADDLAAVHAEIPRVAALYGGVPAVLQELQTDLVYEYQRGSPALTEVIFFAQRQALLRQLLSCPEGISTATAFALNRGVRLEELVAWGPGDPQSLLGMADYLRRIGWYAQAAPYYLQVAQKPVDNDLSAANAHRAWECYLEICIRTQQFDELRKRMPEALKQMQDFERIEFFKRHALPALREDGIDDIQLQELREIFRGIPVFPEKSVESMRLQLIGTVAFRLEDFDEAKAVLRQSLNLGGNPEALQLLASIAEQEQDYPAAARYYQDLLEVQPANRVQILRRQARAYWLGHQISDAVQTYENLISIDPDHRTEYTARVVELTAGGGVRKTGTDKN
ncbi:MAG TPA: O-antigen ligase family protein [Planctomycetota bacterium]|nr:O-antigen ligase family protein [Planctomycetota bacterium]